jgi:hypothetical protein
MRLTCYRLSKEELGIITAPLRREWMDNTEGFAYRCLPIDVANTHGWFILNPIPFMAEWTGGDRIEAINIRSLDPAEAIPLAVSHFGHGVLTFQIPFLLRTEPGFDLWVGGPTNSFKDGIQAITGIVESDWSLFSFTMNWKFTRSSLPVLFSKGSHFVASILCGEGQ